MVAAALDLVPMSTGDILDRTVRIYQRHFLHIVSVVALPYVLLFPVQLAASMFGHDAKVAERLARGLVGPITTVLLVLGLIFLWFVSFAALTRSVSEAFLGRSLSLRASYGAIFRRSGAMAWAYFLSALAMFGGLFLGMGSILGGLFLITRNQAGSTIALFLILLLLGLALLLVGVPAFYRLIFVTPIVMVEDVRGIGALRRSWRLMRGKAMQAFVISIFSLAVALIVGLALGWPGKALANAFPTLGTRILATILEQVANILVFPFWTVPYVLMYYDARIRQEAFDLQTMAQSLALPEGTVGTSPPRKASEPKPPAAPVSPASPTTPHSAGPPAIRPSAPLRGPTGAFKVCPQCGAQVPLVRPTCPKCGARVPFRPA